jgi:uncharacterized protein YpmS
MLALFVICFFVFVISVILFVPSNKKNKTEKVETQKPVQIKTKNDTTKDALEVGLQNAANAHLKHKNR